MTLTTAGGDGSDTESTGGTADDDDDDADETDGDKLDLASGPDLPMVMGCDKMDLLFIVDNSTSMFDEQQNLLASFPSFIAEIEAVLESGDYQVMVIDTDIGPWNGCYDSISNSFDCDLWCGANCSDECDCECNSEPCAPFSTQSCDALLGTGRTVSGDGMNCGFPGRRYLTSEDPNPTVAFECAATVGIGGAPSERPMQAMMDALGVHSEPGGCNEGFLRDDALLIVTLVTDEDDSLASLGDPADWVASVVEAKNDNDNAVVILGLLGDPDEPDGVCGPFEQVGNSGAHPAVRLREFVESFPFGFRASVCEPDYVPFFQDAIGTIDTACEEFVPPG